MAYTNQDLLNAIAKYNELNPEEDIRDITPELYSAHEKLIPIFEYFSLDGDPMASCYLGLCYFRGKGVKANEIKAEELIKNASEKGDAFLQYQYGMFIKRCYIDVGMGGEYRKLAFDEFLKSAEAGYVPAYYEVADMGYFVDKNRERSFYWYSKGADAGDVDCIKQVATAYYGGYGVEKDYNKAIEFWQKAYDMGDLGSLANIANCYAKGLGVEIDYSKALKMYKEVIENTKGGTVYYENRVKEIQDELVKQGRCRYCGGKFKGLFTKKCADCKKKKDYK